jgi:MoaA/NifB/PqqE/SkfB family radical SAM enzyme
MVSIEHLEQSLKKDYNLVIFQDLVSIADRPDSIYRLLDSVAQTEFADQDRIVFYTSETPSTELLDHIHQALEECNIGGFFVVLCCPTVVSLNYSDPITVHQVELTSTWLLGNGFHIPKTVCPVPWTHLEIKHNGDIHPCCVAENAVGNANESSLEEAFYGADMALLRHALLLGNKPSTCDHCWKLEAAGLKSNREWHRGQNLRKLYTEWIQNPKIRSLDLKPGNVCNFKCRICDPVNSSAFADEAKTYKIVSGKWNEYNEYAWSELDALLPQIENLDFYGGEPFLVKQIPKLMQSAVDRGHAKNIRVHFNTNGSIYPNVELFDKFKEIDIAVSIDNVGTRFELERGGSWDTVANNVIKLSQLNATVYLWTTVNIQNVYYLDEVVAWADANHIRVAFNYLDRPTWANIDQLTNSARQLIIDKYAGSAHTELRNIAARVQASTGSDGKEFVAQMKRFDQLRNQNFAETHPEMAGAMGY